VALGAVPPTDKETAGNARQQNLGFRTSHGNGIAHSHPYLVRYQNTQTFKNSSRLIRYPHRLEAPSGMAISVVGYFEVRISSAVIAPPHANPPTTIRINQVVESPLSGKESS
jgi:hypothetical protein